MRQFLMHIIERKDRRVGIAAGRSSRGSIAAGKTAVYSGSSTVQASGNNSGSSIELSLSIDRQIAGITALLLSGVWQYGVSRVVDRRLNGTIVQSVGLQAYWHSCGQVGRSSRLSGATVGWVDRMHIGTINSRWQSDASVVVLVILFLKAHTTQYQLVSFFTASAQHSLSISRFRSLQHMQLNIH